MPNPIAEIALFVGGLLLVAAGLFCAGAAVIYGGGWLFEGLAGLLAGLGLPRPLAFALAVLATVAAVTAGWSRLVDGRR